MMKPYTGKKIWEGKLVNTEYKQIKSQTYNYISYGKNDQDLLFNRLVIYHVLPYFTEDGCGPGRPPIRHKKVRPDTRTKSWVGSGS